MINIFSKASKEGVVLKELLRSNIKDRLVRDTPINFIEVYLSGLLMHNPVLSTDGLVTLQRASKKIINLSTPILEGLIQQIHLHGYTCFPPNKKDKVELENLYSIIRMGNHND